MAVTAMNGNWYSKLSDRCLSLYQRQTTLSNIGMSQGISDTTSRQLNFAYPAEPGGPFQWRRKVFTVRNIVAEDQHDLIHYDTSRELQRIDGKGKIPPVSS
ncbi:hypothetical protein INT44_003614 [Umbelopsis vinacea]|uniref:Uncharacterized protein n=1 Tax=Umbelopsis vinacea TaxID=44442 RepID=A0A8H7PVE9_9FUNG|nr:hypothetical protein INT44_003614 [Umbelopsis vinacea]